MPLVARPRREGLLWVQVHAHHAGRLPFEGSGYCLHDKSTAEYGPPYVSLGAGTTRDDRIKSYVSVSSSYGALVTIELIAHIQREIVLRFCRRTFRADGVDSLGRLEVYAPSILQERNGDVDVVILPRDNGRKLILCRLHDARSGLPGGRRESAAGHAASRCPRQDDRGVKWKQRFRPAGAEHRQRLTRSSN